MWYAVTFIIVLIFFPYFFYPILLRCLPKREKYNGSSIDKQRVSLYIAAYNEESVIAEKIENSLDLDDSGCEFEIVVGSDGSTDRTNEIVTAYSKRNKKVCLLDFQDRQGKVNVLNRGIPLCNGDIILLSDANAIYNKECLQQILPHFVDQKVGCVAGEKRIADSNGSISKNEGFYWKLESKIKALEDRVSTVIGADGACYAIRKSLFQTLPKETSVDDFLLSMKIVEQGFVIEYEPNAYSFEDTGSDVHQEMKRKIRIAAGNFYNMHFLKRFLGLDLISLMYVGHKVLRWISPLLFLLLTLSLSYLSLYSGIARLMLCMLLCSYAIPYMKYRGFGKVITDNNLGNTCSYFYLTVWAQWLGYKKYRAGTQKAIWDTIR